MPRRAACPERHRRSGVPVTRDPSHPAREAWLTGAMLALTAIALIGFAVNMFDLAAGQWSGGPSWETARLALFVGVILVLSYGNVVYQISRLGFVLRLQRSPAGSEGLPHTTAGEIAPPLTILVPSYKEDLRTIRQTLLSAALQEYPNRRLVLLLDDPPAPNNLEDATRLAAARRLPVEIMALLSAPAERARRAADAFAVRAAQGRLDARWETRMLLDAYAEADDWFAAQAAATPRQDHTDDLFVELVFDGPRTLLGRSARRILRSQENGVSAADLRRDYARLVELFRVEIATFERKRFVNLSHEPNKAANLNSYLGLIGKHVREERHVDGLHLVVTEPDKARTDDIAVPDATYVITLDADSLLAPDYARRLAAVMAAPGHERLAVVQTPYTAIPGSPGALERIAGATTDIQYLIHQGFTWCNATFWVGANALLRKAALDDIRTVEVERGHRVARFIQDRTVIEDTESTIDLVARGWRLHNYPERMAFSATPPDFGSLLVQRRRWANGGLLILPKLVRYAVASSFSWRKPLEVFVRAHYLGSICGSSLALLALLVLPIEEGFASPWLPLIALPYFLLYWRDLIQAGYRRGDILRVYAFNLLLLPINLAGVLKSLQQAVTGTKIPFGRTPKVEGRTSAPAWAVLTEWFLLAYCASAAAWDAAAGRWLHALFTAGTAAMLTYALVAFVGLRASAQDVRAGLLSLGANVSPRHTGTRPVRGGAMRLTDTLRWLMVPSTALASIAIFSIVLASGIPQQMPSPTFLTSVGGQLWDTVRRSLDEGTRGTTTGPATEARDVAVVNGFVATEPVRSDASGVSPTGQGEVVSPTDVRPSTSSESVRLDEHGRASTQSKPDAPPADPASAADPDFHFAVAANERVIVTPDSSRSPSVMPGAGWRDAAGLEAPAVAGEAGPSANEEERESLGPGASQVGAVSSADRPSGDTGPASAAAP